MSTSIIDLLRALADVRQTCAPDEWGILATFILSLNLSDGAAGPERHALAHNEYQEADRLLDEKEAAAFLRVSRSYLAKSRVHGTGPSFVKIGRRVAYAPDDLRSFASRNRRTSTSDSDQGEASGSSSDHDDFHGRLKGRLEIGGSARRLPPPNSVPFRSRPRRRS